MGLLVFFASGFPVAEDAQRRLPQAGKRWCRSRRTEDARKASNSNFRASGCLCLRTERLYFSAVCRVVCRSPATSENRSAQRVERDGEAVGEPHLGAPAEQLLSLIHISEPTR